MSVAVRRSKKRRQRANPGLALRLLALPGAQLVILNEEQSLILLGNRSKKVNQATLELLRTQQWITERPVAILECSLSAAGRQLVRYLEENQRGYTQLHFPEFCLSHTETSRNS